jgi:hypothetical protein
LVVYIVERLAGAAFGTILANLVRTSVARLSLRFGVTKNTPKMPEVLFMTIGKTVLSRFERIKIVISLRKL